MATQNLSAQAVEGNRAAGPDSKGLSVQADRVCNVLFFLEDIFRELGKEDEIVFSGPALDGLSWIIGAVWDSVSNL